MGIDLRERRHATARIDSEQRGSTRGSRSSDRAPVPIQHGCAARGFLVKTFVMMRTILEQFHHIKNTAARRLGRVVVATEKTAAVVVAAPRRRPGVLAARASRSRDRRSGAALGIARAGCPPLRPARRGAGRRRVGDDAALDARRPERGAGAHARAAQGVLRRPPLAALALDARRAPPRPRPPRRALPPRGVRPLRGRQVVALAVEPREVPPRVEEPRPDEARAGRGHHHPHGRHRGRRPEPPRARKHPLRPRRRRRPTAGARAAPRRASTPPPRPAPERPSASDPPKNKKTPSTATYRPFISAEPPPLPVPHLAVPRVPGRR